MTFKIADSSRLSADQTSFYDTSKKILVTLSSVNASPKEEAQALLKALGFTQSDIEAFKDKYGIDLKERFAAEFSGKASRITKDASSKAGFQAYIGISSHNYKLLTGFLAERRGVPQTQPKANGGGAAKIVDKNNQAKQEQIKLNQLFKDAQILETSSFGTPSKLNDLKHISGVEMPNIAGLSAEDQALAGYIEQRYVDRSNLYVDDKADILRLAKTNGVKIENLSVSNGKADFDISVESLLKLQIAYIGVQEKANITEAQVKDQQNNSAYNQFLIGIGEGAWNNLKDTKQAITDPVGTLHGIYEAAKTAGSLAVELAQMSETERLQLYAQLGKAGLKGLGEMPLNVASRKIGNFIGSLAVDAALGKGIGTAIKALHGLKIGTKIISETVALSKTVKQTLGNIKVPLSDMKVVSDTMGNKWWIRDGELKKLEDIIKPMESRAKDAVSGGRRNLEIQEVTGGHTIERHVGKSESWLRKRLENDVDLRYASSFRNEAIANRVQGRFVKRFRNEIEEWFKTNSNPFKKDFDMLEPVGNTVERGKAGEVLTSKVRVIVVKDASSSQGWRIHTSFPIIKEGVK